MRVALDATPLLGRRTGIGHYTAQLLAALAKGEVTVSDRLAQDLVFFCSQAVPARAADAPALTAVRLA